MRANFYDQQMSLQQEKTALTEDMKGQRKVLFSHLKLQPGENFLEVGSGNGIFAREAKLAVGPAGSVVGVDASPDMVKLSKTLCPEATFYVADAANLPLGDGCFDAVLMAQVLCFVEDMSKAIAELYRCLKPGGRLVILDTHWDSLVWNITESELRTQIRQWIAKPYVRDDVPAVLSDCLDRAGFEISGRSIHPVVNWSFNRESYSGQLIEYFKGMAAEDGPLATKLLDHWLSELQAKSDAGTYLFSVCRYIFCASKP